MTRQLSLALVASILCLSGTAAWGQTPTLPNFAGAYVGVLVGLGGQRVEVDNETLGTEFHDRDTSFTVGGYGGYNWRCDILVFGVETDLNYLGTSPTALDIEIGPTGLNETTSLNSRFEWFGTLRGRVGGLVNENWLLYGTAGLAYARFNHTLADNCVGCGNSLLNLGQFLQSNGATKYGYTVGGGAEYLDDDQWMLRAEALYVDVGSAEHSYFIVAPAGTASAATKWHDEFWVARLGLGFAFGGP
jgi:outer membrane immunogenic protein